MNSINPFKRLSKFGMVKLTSFLSVVLCVLFLAGGCVKDEPHSSARIPIRTYLKRLKSDQDDTVDRALQAIAEIGGPGVPYIIEAWEKSDTETRYKLCKALYLIGPAAKEAVPLLSKALDDLDEKMISHAAEALSGIGPASSPAVPRLTALMRASDTSTQVNILRALGRIGPDAAPAISVVMEAVDRERTREFAIQALSNMGPQVTEKMKEWLRSPNPTHMLAACEVLGGGKSDDPTILTLLTQAFEEKDPQIRIAAVRAISNSGAGALQVIDKLIDALSDKNDEVRRALIITLAELSLNEKAQPALINATSHRNARVREGIIQVISRSASLRDSAIPKLIFILADSDVYVRLAAINALTSCGEMIIPQMIQQLRSAEVTRRFGGARVLGNLGAAARKALPELRKLQSDRDSLVREEANKAITKITES